ncbi:hypothetical protein [Mucilaginibacter sp. dw_454]|uniref:hypothetical protein n=1 Tax=Mucilaginibacter sp. dw_454 TaxID=2720079 RepID=UPI001BD2D11B|nr:hypothetical protein [Mucilaginibacter sp. dw_454]
MKLLTRLVLFLICFVLFNSCKKHDENTPPITAKLKYLTKQISVATSIIGTTTTITNYNYDDNKRLVAQETGTTVITYAYDNNGNLSLVTYKTNDEIVYTQTFTYTDGKVSAAIRRTYQNGVVMTTDTYSFVFSGNNITEIHSDGDNGPQLSTYSYDTNNDIVRVIANTRTTLYTYDDKKNRFTNVPPTFKNVLIGSAEICSPNNFTSVGDGSTTQIYNYNYDSDGYPTARYLNAGFQTFTYSYFYTEL